MMALYKNIGYVLFIGQIFMILYPVAAHYEEAYFGDGGYSGYHHQKPQGHIRYRDEFEHQFIQAQEQDREIDFTAYPKYSFDYSVKDAESGDDKSHWETRDGDKVKGTYSLIDSDGTQRVVEYEADDKNGFNAVVHRVGYPKDDVWTNNNVNQFQDELYGY